MERVHTLSLNIMMETNNPDAVSRVLKEIFQELEKVTIYFDNIYVNAK